MAGEKGWGACQRPLELREQRLWGGHGRCAAGLAPQPGGLRALCPPRGLDARLCNTLQPLRRGALRHPGEPGQAEMRKVRWGCRPRPPSAPPGHLPPWRCPCCRAPCRPRGCARPALRCSQPDPTTASRPRCVEASVRIDAKASVQSQWWDRGDGRPTVKGMAAVACPPGCHTKMDPRPSPSPPGGSHTNCRCKSRRTT